MATKPLERDVKAYLLERVKALGGECRKVSWEGRRGAPDWFVMLPGSRPNFWCELKAPGKKAEPHQEREIARMIGYDEIVHVFDSPEAIDRVLAHYEGRR
jgi:hypothetical protein